MERVSCIVRRSGNAIAPEFTAVVDWRQDKAALRGLLIEFIAQHGWAEHRAHEFTLDVYRGSTLLTTFRAG